MKIKKIYTSKGHDWEIRPLSEAETVYQYFPEKMEVGKLQPIFFLKDKEERAGYSFPVERKVFIVLDLIAEEIKIFIAPISIWNQIEHFINKNVEIHKTGKGMKTRYSSHCLHQ
ncbi:hypothetical protein LCGC14_1608740, partial [marine sediment metagenome]